MIPEIILRPRRKKVGNAPRCHRQRAAPPSAVEIGATDAKLFSKRNALATRRGLHHRKLSSGFQKTLPHTGQAEGVDAAKEVVRENLGPQNPFGVAPPHVTDAGLVAR